MSNEKKLLKSSYAFLALWIILLTGIFTPFFGVVSFTDRKNPGHGFMSREAYKKGFSINYTHSVNKGRVHDFYRIEKDGKLNLYKTIFVSYGAGIPEPEETAGAVFTVIDSGYEISNLNRKLNKLDMFVGVIAEHSITIAPEESDVDEEIFLKTIFKPQTGLEIKTRKVSCITLVINMIKTRF